MRLLRLVHHVRYILAQQSLERLAQGPILKNPLWNDRKLLRAVVRLALLIRLLRVP